MRWKPIILGYEVSDYIVSDTGIVKNKTTGKELKPYINNDGYCRLDLRHNGMRYNKFVHVLVAEAFITNELGKPSVNHIDGNKLHNCVNNLEWATFTEQQLHAYKLGLRSSLCGSKSGNSKYTDPDIHKVCKYLELGVPIKEISVMTKIPIHTISDIYQKRSWRSISKMYNFKKYTKTKFDIITIDKIKLLISNNMKAKEICNKLNIEYSDSVKQVITRLRRKLDKGSTTIERDEDKYLYIDIKLS